MNFIASINRIAEIAPLPVGLMRLGIDRIVARSAMQLAVHPEGSEEMFVRDMVDHPIAEFASSANEQHYELPPEFFARILGPQRKYSCCLYDQRPDTLAAAEERALSETAAHAELADGQHILELGCGWGSLSLWIARHYPRAQIVAVSNSQPQRAYIESVARDQGIGNLTVVTADMNIFEPGAQFDRIVSVEMFEHMANWERLLARVRTWLTPDGRLFLHVFSHRDVPYRFNHDDPNDWIAQHFFTGGIMPSHRMIRHFDSFFTLEQEWRWNGSHYAKTALDWLANYDRNIDELMPILRDVYGDNASLWRRRWRIFFLATAGLFGHQNGDLWAVSHYRLRPARSV